jgi:hypothetical protein
MLYRSYRITFVDLNYDNPVFLISKRHDQTILGKTTSVASAIELIQMIDKQGELILDPGVARPPLAGSHALPGETP